MTKFYATILYYDIAHESGKLAISFWIENIKEHYNQDLMAQSSGVKNTPTASLQRGKTPPTNILDITYVCGEASVMLEH